MGKSKGPDLLSRYGEFPWLISGAVDFKLKDAIIRDLVNDQMTRTVQMFEWKGLPDTIPSDILETMLQGNGHAIVTKQGQDIVAFVGSRGGDMDIYYRPKTYIVSNPWSSNETSKEYTVGKDGIVIPSDSLYRGLSRLNSRYATLMADNELSMWIASIMLRAQAMIAAGNDNDYAVANDFIAGLIRGDMKAVLSKGMILEQGINAQPLFSASNVGSIGQLIEYEQYIKASWMNEIGLDANYNMKRESLSMTESQMNDDALAPLPENMLFCRKRACDEINALYGTSISVDFSSSWKRNQEAAEMATEQPQENAEGGKEDEPGN